jgi:type II secretion system protein G
MKRQRASSHGFTILEVLITIVVIGILAAITFFSYQGIQERSRDSTRESDIALIKIALEKYYADNSQYPSVCEDGDGVNCPAKYLATALSSYLPEVPKDPRYADNPNGDYLYMRGGESGNAYGLRVSYEAKEQCKTGVRMESSWWGEAAPDCSVAGGFVAVAPTITTQSFEEGYAAFEYPYSPQVGAVYANGTLPLTFSIISGALPTGVTLNPSTGIISGTATGVATIYNFTVQVTNNAGSDTQAFSVNILPIFPR